MRSDAEQAARMMGLDFKIDAILNGHAQICNLFVSDFEAEIQHAAAYAAEHYAAKFVPDCDVVIANNYFKPAEANCAYTPEVIARSRTAARSCSRPTPRSARVCTSCTTSGVTPPPAA